MKNRSTGRGTQPTAAGSSTVAPGARTRQLALPDALAKSALVIGGEAAAYLQLAFRELA